MGLELHDVCVGLVLSFLAHHATEEVGELLDVLALLLYVGVVGHIVGKLLALLGSEL